MSKNDGGSAMTLDLESLRDLLWEIDNQVVTHGIGYREVITRTERVVSEVIAELAARRIIEAVRNQAWPQNSPPNPHAKRSMKSANALFCQRRQWMRWPDLAANWPSCNKRRAGNRLRLRRGMGRLFCFQDAICPFGKVAGLEPAGDMRSTVGHGLTAWTLTGTRPTGSPCPSRRVAPNP